MITIHGKPWGENCKIVVQTTEVKGAVGGELNDSDKQENMSTKKSEGNVIDIYNELVSSMKDISNRMSTYYQKFVEFAMKINFNFGRITYSSITNFGRITYSV